MATAERNFMALLQGRWDEGKFVCVGLDSDTEKLPDSLKEKHGPCDAQLAFNKAIVDATNDLVCCYKPNLAFYRGGNGKFVLRDTLAYIHKVAPGVPVILDAKYADIGNTNDGYVHEAFGFLNADAVTVHPYLGMEAMKPFLDQKNKGVIVLVRTSNPGAGEFQDLTVNIREEGGIALGDVVLARSGIGIIQAVPLYQTVARNVAASWNYNGNCAVVVGATYPDELVEVRRIVGDMPILIPGVGEQGGDMEETMKAGANSKGQGMIVNNARKVIFASPNADFAEAARAVVQEMHDKGTAILTA